MAEPGREKMKKGTPTQFGAPAEPPEHMGAHLNRLEYPARIVQLINQAETKHVPSDVVKVLHRLPDREYANAREVQQAVQEVHSQP